MKAKKSWKEKLADSKDLPKVVEIPKKAQKRWGRGTIAIPAPLEVDALMKKVPQGKLTTINEIRSKIAKKHKATIGCPITAGIFSWIAANAAEEESKEGKKDITPYWRTLKTGGILNEKYPGGINNQKKLLQSEGHKIIQKGKNYIVENYEKKIV
jgi:alkylated DNA nucleotide flippase Atl1